MAHPVDTLEYWVEDFAPSSDEQAALYAYCLESGKAIELEELAAHAIRTRIERMMAAHKKPKKGDGAMYKPNDRYEKGQKLIFPVFDDLTGSVVSVRPGNNPHYGEYEVIQVKTSDGVREFATGLDTPHLLTAPEIDVDPKAVATRFRSLVAPSLATILASDSDWVHYGDRWMLADMLPEVNLGHRNLAEAVIMLAGGPLPAADLIKELEFEGDPSNDAKEFALVLALSADKRFRNVGALEAPLWALSAQLEG